MIIVNNQSSFLFNQATELNLRQLAEKLKTEEKKINREDLGEEDDDDFGCRSNNA